MASSDLIKQVNIQKIAEEGAKIYEREKAKYEPQKNGNFLAIDIESQELFLGNTSSDAVELARKAHPEKVFYVIKIGHSVAETLASLGIA